MCDPKAVTAERQVQALENACFIRKLCKEWRARKERGLVKMSALIFRESGEMVEFVKCAMFEAIEKKRSLEKSRTALANNVDSDGREAAFYKSAIEHKEKELADAESKISNLLCTVALEFFEYNAFTTFFPRLFWKKGLHWVYWEDTMYALITDEYPDCRKMEEKFYFIHKKTEKAE